MNEEKNIFRDVVIVITLLLLLGSSISCGVLGIKYSKCRNELEQCVEQLRYARESNAEYAETFDRLGECLSQQVYTIAGLRSQLQEIYKYYKNLEDCLHSGNTCNGNSIVNSNDSGLQ